MKSIKDIDLSSEFNFKTSRSSGKGGQSVNKVATRVELHFDIVNSSLLRDDQKELILKKLKNRISNYGILHIASDNARTQLTNKKLVIEKCYELLEKALKVSAKRIPTKSSKGANEKRLKEKRKQAEKKKKRDKDLGEAEDYA